MKLIVVGMLLIIIGFVVVMAGVVKMVKTEEAGSIRGGGVILIGPFPIVFGTDRDMVLISITGAALLLLALYLWRRG
jgi:uncharacterized protein (TIGR00304 family)